MKTEVLEDTVADTTRGATSDMLSRVSYMFFMSSMLLIFWFAL